MSGVTRFNVFTGIFVFVVQFLEFFPYFQLCKQTDLSGLTWIVVFEYTFSGLPEYLWILLLESFSLYFNLWHFKVALKKYFYSEKLYFILKVYTWKRSKQIPFKITFHMFIFWVFTHIYLSAFNHTKSLWGFSRFSSHQILLRYLCF